MPLFESIISGLQDLKTSKYTNVCGLCLFGYDIVLTFQSEYRHIWKARWSVSKVMYLFVRYPWFIQSALSCYANLSPNVTVKFCSFFSPFEVYAGIAELFVVQLILTLRTYVIYQKQRWILWVLLPALVLGNGVDVALMAVYGPRIVHYPPSYTPLNSGCLKYCVGCRPLFTWFWVPQVVIDAIIFTLTLVKATHHAKHDIHRTPVMATLYRDGFLYFVAIFVCETAHLVMWNTAPESKLEAFAPIQRALISIMCCRLLLNIRGALTQEKHMSIPTTFLHVNSSSHPNAFELVEMESTPSQEPSMSKRRLEAWET